MAKQAGKCLVLSLALLALQLPAEAAAQDVEQFFRGKSIKLISGFGPASGYSAWARLIGLHLGRQIPGEPPVIVQNMVGASGIRAANYIYAAAPKDGSELAAVARETAALSVMGGGGIAYDATALNWIGSPTSESNICVFAKASGIVSAQDLFAKEAIVGSDGAGSGMHIFPLAMNAILGTKFKVIGGYPDSGEVLLAIDRGELQGACQSVETLTQVRGEALRTGQLHVVLQGGLKPNPAFAGVQFVLDLAKTETEKQALQFLYAGQTFGRPLVAPPGVPSERVAALRAAFEATMRDPAFLADVARQKLTLSPIPGDEMQDMAANVAKTPRAISSKIGELLNPQK
jgi:tripartite-type tricarboxylate transporter receptor subunit TctC